MAIPSPIPIPSPAQQAQNAESHSHERPLATSSQSQSYNNFALRRARMELVAEPATIAEPSQPVRTLSPPPITMDLNSSPAFDYLTATYELNRQLYGVE